MRVVVKVGGAALDDKARLQDCVAAIAELVRNGHQVAVVHGGGSMLTRTLKLLGKPSEFVNELRITDAETRDIALMVLAGKVNKTLVAALAAAGFAAIGLCGGDGMTFRASKKRAAGLDLGFVGEICAVEPRWLHAIWNQDGIPVLAPMALGLDGAYYNVNADEMAAACAIACSADELIFLTDVPGVKDADGTIIRWLSVKDAEALATGSVITGGMLPKLGACRQALKAGVGRVQIMPAAQAGCLSRADFADLPCGTEVVSA